MGRHRTVDGSETETVTLRLPVWLIEHYTDEGRLELKKPREHMRDILLAHGRGQLVPIQYEPRGADSHGE